MPGAIIPEGEPNIVNLSEKRECCFCGGLIRKRKQMWKYPDGSYLCIFCKTRFDEAVAKGVTFTSGQEVFECTGGCGANCCRGESCRCVGK